MPAERQEETAAFEAIRREQYASLADRTWLNTAHQGVLPEVAAAAAREAVEWKRQPWRMTSERFAEVPGAVRRRLARLLAVPEREVVLANSSSYGLHLVANGFPWRSGDEVVVVRGDFPSTTLPWRGLAARGVAVVEIERAGEVVTAEEVEAALGPRSRVFCTNWVHSFTGHAADARAIGEVCRARGVRFVLNASQGTGARPLAPAELPVDAVTGVGFKWLCGPYGTGYCWLSEELLDEIEYNQLYWLAFQTADDLAGGTEPDIGRARTIGARRYDVFGTANFFNYAAWGASLRMVLDLGVDAIHEHDQALVERLVSGLPDVRFELASPRSGPSRSTLVIFSDRSPEANGEHLARLRAAGVHGVLRRGRLRLAPHLYNTAAEIDRALEALAG